jgi:hypothetical protein
MKCGTLVILLLASSLAAQVAQPQTAGTQAPASDVKRAVYEGVVALEGKTIGTSILLEIREKPGADGSRPVGGWIQRNDFYPIDSGNATADHVIFTSRGNQYDINLNTLRITYSGRDGSGNQRLEKMSHVEGRVYKLTEEADEERTMTLQISGDEKDFLVGEPTVWKRNGPPLIHFSRLEEILGKTTGFWLSRFGTMRYVAIMEEPPGMDLQKKAPKEKRDKKKK